jgi:hypothetical protein
MNRLHVTWNAADAHNSFCEASINRRPGDELTTTEVTGVLARKVGRLFALAVHSEDPPTIFSLRFTAMLGDKTFLVRDIEGASYEDLVEVASEPPPRLSPIHGDYIFDLVSVDPSSIGQS